MNRSDYITPDWMLEAWETDIAVTMTRAHERQNMTDVERMAVGVQIADSDEPHILLRPEDWSVPRVHVVYARGQVVATYETRSAAMARAVKLARAGVPEVHTDRVRVSQIAWRPEHDAPQPVRCVVCDGYVTEANDYETCGEACTEYVIDNPNEF